jgi:hypothetical protein
MPSEQKGPGFEKTRSVRRLIVHRAAGAPKLGPSGMDIQAIRKASTPGGAWLELKVLQRTDLTDRKKTEINHILSRAQIRRSRL